MKIYNKKGFAVSILLIALGVFNAAAGFMADNLDMKTFIVIAALFAFGFVGVKRSLSEEFAREDKIEECDERNRLIDMNRGVRGAARADTDLKGGRQMRKRIVKDERDEQIDSRSKVMALDFMIAVTQILTVMCLIKGNPAWKGSFALLFLGGAVQFLYKFQSYEARQYLAAGIVAGLIGVFMLVWFGITG